MELTAERLLKIINSISDGVFTVDMNFVITFMNESASRILKISSEDALGRKCYELMDSNVCREECPLRKTLNTQNSIINKQICLSIPDKRIPLSVSTSVIRDDEGKIVGGVETFRDLSQLEELKKELKRRYTFEDIIGKSPQMQKMFELISMVAESNTTVLIEGESGVGKELIANAIHSKSNRSNMPMVSVNCSALPDTLIESELFGYVPGAFTDAKKKKEGRFASAEGGTLFLDEIGELAPMVQVKMLRVMQDKKYQPLGSSETKKADVRIITATNKNIDQLVEEKKFRKDFYYRINVIKIKVPPLRERMEDVPLLIEHFIDKFNYIYNRQVEGISPYALNTLMHYDFPGNVRELENIIEHTFVLSRGSIIRPEHLPEKFSNKKPLPAIEIASNMDELESVFLISVLKRNNWNRKKSAEELDINPSTLYRKLKKLGISPPAKGGNSNHRKK